MIRCTKPPTVRYTMIRNEWARDQRLSYKARGLLTYLHSHTDGYECSLAQITRESTDGKDAVRTGLEELEAAGYLTRLRSRSGGRFGETDYVLADPFDPDGRLTDPAGREIRLPYADDERETRQSGLSAPVVPDWEIRPPDAEDERIIRRSGKSAEAENPLRQIRPPDAGDGREIRPLEQQEKTKEVLTTSPLSPLALVPDPADRFDEFWDAYPKKVSKADARRAWAKVTRRVDPDRLIAAVKDYPFDLTRIQYVPYPATWLNGGRWDDDPAAVRPRRDNAGYGPSLRPSARPEDYHDPGWRTASHEPPDGGHRQ